MSFTALLEKGVLDEAWQDQEKQRRSLVAVEVLREAAEALDGLEVKLRAVTSHALPAKDGVGDARIPQLTDVYRAPAKARKERLQ